MGGMGRPQGCRHRQGCVSPAASAHCCRGFRRCRIRLSHMVGLSNQILAQSLRVQVGGKRPPNCRPIVVFLAETAVFSAAQSQGGTIVRFSSKPGQKRVCSKTYLIREGRWHARENQASAATARRRRQRRSLPRRSRKWSWASLPRE